MNLWRILLVAVVAFLATATPASAHVQLTASNPERGAALAAPPQSIQLTFNDVLKSAPTITVTDPNGTEWSMGRPTADNKVVTVPVDPQQGPAGQYVIQYRVTGSDNHLIVGDVKFTITTAFGQQRPPELGPQTDPVKQISQESTPDSGGPLVWPWIVGLVLVLGVGVFVFVRFRPGDKSGL